MSPEKDLRYNWQLDEISALYSLPFMELAYRAQTVHRDWFKNNQVQLCTLSNIKEGGCPEDCKYCSQSSRYKTEIKPEPLIEPGEILAQAKEAKSKGATRFCMGAAWREVKDNRQFEAVLESVRQVSALGVEVCVTLGMVNDKQAVRLAEAGVTAYNHNIDTSPEYYGEVITTRTFQDRLDTLASVRKAGMTVCCGGILGLGESREDRVSMLQVLATMNPHPESVPINRLVPIPGTPYEGQPEVDVLEFLRTLGVARILMPSSMIRLAAGRESLTREAQVMALMMGANSIFFGERLLTTSNSQVDADTILFKELGLEPMPPKPLQRPVGS
jgi:biotin synthase